MQTIGQQPQRAPDGVPIHCERHRPENSALYRLVPQHAAGFVAHTEASTGSELARFINDEFELNGDGWVHKAFSGGASTCTAVAAQIAGTIVHECSSVDTTPRRVCIGHPSGVLPIYAQVEQGDADGLGWVVREVHFSRTVRRLMDGTAYIRRSAVEG